VTGALALTAKQSLSNDLGTFPGNQNAINQDATNARDYSIASDIFLGAAACSLLVSVSNEQCATNADCTSRGGAFTHAVCQNNLCVSGSAQTGNEAGSEDSGVLDPWYCLDLPAQQNIPGETVAVTLKLFNPLDPIAQAPGASDLTAESYTGVPGLTVEACSGILAPCVPNTGPNLVPGPVEEDSGQATVVVPQDFSGYVQYTGTGYLPSTLYMGNLLPDASTFAPPTQVLADSLLEGLAVELGVNVEGAEAGVGLGFFLVFDCFDNHQPGVAFSLSPNPGPAAVTWYAKGSDSLPSTAATLTDENGTAGTVNLPAGSVTVTATIVASQKIIGSSQLLISPGWATTAWIRARTH
jgi:hypothetical protein